jgi:4-amino-4-deoxychorismate lyase
MQIGQVRVLVSARGEIAASATPTGALLMTTPITAASFNPDTDDPARFGSALSIVLDSQPTSASIFTSTKTTHRSQYDNARSRAGVSKIGMISAAHQPADVLMYNDRDEIMETSIRNIALWRSGQWITPLKSTGCLPGVVRRHLLERGAIREPSAEDFTPKKAEVKDGEWLLLFNAVEGCRIGRLHLSA